MSLVKKLLAPDAHVGKTDFIMLLFTETLYYSTVSLAINEDTYCA